jgi:sugar transferase (PEP-CTERM/EpsH1 system associated)
MKILWIKTDFLHPTTRGGQIRTLEMLRRLHTRHEVHYICFDDPSAQEGPARVHEYSTQAYAVPHNPPEKRLSSLAFLAQLAKGLISPLPVAVNRWRSTAMRDKIAQVCAQNKFDVVVCDFLFPAPNLPELKDCVLFQHNVEAMIWHRHAGQASWFAKKLYFQLQARRMSAYEYKVCASVRRVVAVSDADATMMRELYGVKDVRAVATGVDLDYFHPPESTSQLAKFDLVFIGSMDWMPNVDGVQWLASDILPLIYARRPATTVAIVGRKPSPPVLALAANDSRITVTGTVADVRPFLWGSQVSIVPLKVGGGTRLKIFESMAARVPVVSTTIGAEGLHVTGGRDIVLADSAQAFAEACLQLLTTPARANQIADAAFALVKDNYGWDAIAWQFEAMLV